MQKTHSPLPEKFKTTLPPKEIIELMPRQLLQEFGAFIFSASKNEIKIAALDPENSTLKDFIAERFTDKISWFQATQEDIDFILQNYKRDFKEEILALTEIETGNTTNIVELGDLIIEYALKEKASDIHIEPTRNDVVVRFRIDGILHTMVVLPKEIHAALIARFKILSNLRIDEFRLPQDGRIELENKTSTSLRVSTAPTLYGEKIAMRILDDTHKDISIEHLGFSKEQADILLRNAEKPFGMIVASGPTGSGKTTTLYSLLNLLKKDGINISTLEDPIEYALDGANQIQINTRINLSFASGLRSLLRQDPDVIMIGEIRDSETALMAADAALTGHIVFTTVHTNDAPSVLTRFIEMDVEDFMVVSVVNLVVGQRLVRKVCEHCAKLQKLEPVILKKIEERKDIMQILGKMKISLSDLKEKTFNAGQGCEACLDTGYLGRVGMFELLELNKEIHDMVLEHASPEKIKDTAEASGFKDMTTDGLEKVFAGITTFEEVLRTTRNT
ncbi:MAG: hypothetical protein A3A97_04240 [Candidatus Terrybacteria bacterium RIFCSPLOWO2_01_FULL_40_23]|uniref:Bacterial type II secretion system protein E domain-containing protein n=1 Tax=Candidatus Terrybacteria bacterium RIFCSPLOWO2_01_FULL_40_23 TaxID=1802366 RepID=A0A1G2PYN0_9BACT|nr:MAG: hypothetical protein A3A97_04240 [Candidatus Terrybacteria bacterium RIFCSPLOWO2_01_FULL_40_23]